MAAVIDLTHENDLDHDVSVPELPPLKTLVVAPALKRKRSQKKPSARKSITKTKAPKCPPEGYCVCSIDIGLKNFSLAIMQQNTIDHVTGIPTRPMILAWENANLYADRVGGKIIKYEAADKLIQRINMHLDTIGNSLEGGWQVVNEVCIESQSASTNAIKRVESMVFAYFVFKHPHIHVRTISASCKLKLGGMNHTKDETASYKDRKNLSIKYARQFMESAPEDCPFKHILTPPPRQPRKKKGEIREPSTVTDSLKTDDLSDCYLAGLYVLGVPVTQQV